MYSLELEGAVRELELFFGIGNEKTNPREYLLREHSDYINSDYFATEKGDLEIDLTTGELKLAD